MELSLSQIRHLVVALGKCPSMQSESARTSVIQLLDPEIQDNLERGKTPRQEVFHILTTCLKYPQGPAALISAIQFFDEGTTALAQFTALFEDYHLDSLAAPPTPALPAAEPLDLPSRWTGDELAPLREEMPHGGLRYPEWLKAYGFSDALFSPLAGKVETDPLFQGDYGLGAYADPENFEQILAYKYFFIPPGGGKTSLCRRIHSQYEMQSLDARMPSGVLVVDYDQHEDYPLNEITPLNHLRRIGEAIAAQFPELSQPLAGLEQYRTYPSSANYLLKVAAGAGYRLVLVLVDHIARSGMSNLEAFRLVRPLAERSDHDPRPQLRFAFFLDPQVRHDSHNHLDLDANPPAPYELTPSFLRRILNKRFNLAASERSPAHTLMFESGNYAQIENYFLKIGLQTQSVRAVWQFGERLMREHFKRGFARYSDRITRQLALKTFTEFLKERKSYPL